ncbi:4-hydroxy-4-methyl-2-oxoglutarate aldolase [Colletotrichum gloeosporioides]|uniref:4-hydroxy-4-methyl-2-oxoglutarate aldolase n=1 Tax=Colletotrichum gloeosporioides TaxID=474922 RepID=A0A8H4FCT0_COLGL|nr:4-hydroxy-4-methyl-2-oxoglutarate aldolase [Colletotrichum gloeosporioides]KAF3797286.1 4-hydroxy-4-methyl-2-oxoglutarate aldolase [Colletotrichum gloeosporioides]
MAATQLVFLFLSCDVADTLTRLDVPGGGFLPGLTLRSPNRQSGQTRIDGPAFAVKCSSAREGNATLKAGTGHFVSFCDRLHELNILMDHRDRLQLESVPRGAVILIFCPENTINYCWGGLTTRRAQALEAVGTVIDGRMRDLEELRELGGLVSGRDVAPTPPHGVLHVGERIFFLWSYTLPYFLIVVVITVFVVVTIIIVVVIVVITIFIVAFVDVVVVIIIIIVTIAVSFLIISRKPVQATNLIGSMSRSQSHKMTEIPSSSRKTGLLAT